MNIVRTAVRGARNSGSVYVSADLDPSAEDACRLMDSDVVGWFLSPATENLGRLVAGYPERFGRSLLTTNFDPLIEVAVRRAGGQYFRTTLHLDGNLSQTEGTGCHVIHLHGYWYGSDTLHTVRQLGQSRPRLRASLSSLLRHKLVVVCAYGGWDDAFTEALMDVVRDDGAYPEIIWTFHSPQPTLGESLERLLEPGINRGRVNLYSGIDCHRFFPSLYDAWSRLEDPRRPPAPAQSNPVRVSNKLSQEIAALRGAQTVLEGDDEDRPPVVEICVGREAELKAMVSSPAKVVFLTGIGGQGKSTLAARYFSDSQTAQRFSFYIWRDCKEESEHFENQLASVVEKLPGGRVRGEDLAKRSASSIVELLEVFTKGLEVLFIFDNADHYINLEANTLTGSPQIFVDALLRSSSGSKAIFTCRPSIDYDDPRVLSVRLEGIDFNAAIRLFEQRSAPVMPAEVRDAHLLTEGHAFWLDLLAIQSAKRAPDNRLSDLLEEIRAGGGTLPDKTLLSIWTTLHAREQLVLRTMAETVKPETEAELEEYLRHEMNYSKLIRALRALRALNLVVVKRPPNAPDVLELHPLVRQFIRTNFPRQERLSVIDAIIKVYKRFIGNHKGQLGEGPALSVLQYWTQNAELDVTAGRINDAFSAMAEVGNAFLSSAYPREFCRCASILFGAVNWREKHSHIKHFEFVMWVYVRLLSYLGEDQSVDALLEEYGNTVQDKDVRYINYCEMRSHAQWVRGEFTSAVEWGKRGHSLQKSGVDTHYDIAHTLALAERDAGEPESALPIFLQGRALSEVTDLEELEEERGGSYYGNIGRCLHLMGQIEPALVCYQKSALIIEKDPGHEHVLNQGYIRLWVGELLVAREAESLAHTFFRAAFLKWQDAYPLRAAAVKQFAEQIKLRLTAPPNRDENVERTCLDWILGRRVDA